MDFATSRTFWAGLISVGFSLAACQSKAPPAGQEFPCVAANGIYAEPNTNFVLIFPDAPAEVTLEVSASENGVTVPIYFVDVEGDGQFEITATTPFVDLQLLQMREYPVQVTAVRCSDRAMLVARTSIAARAVSYPSILLAYEPSPAYPALFGTQRLAKLTIVGDDNNPPYNIAVDWGDGNRIVLDGNDAYGEFEFQHVYAAPGLYAFHVVVTDTNRLTVTSDEIFVAMIATTNVFQIDLGREFNDFALLDTNPADGSEALVAMATGLSGLAIMAVSDTSSSLAARLDLGFPEGRPAHQIQVDSVHNIAYVGSESDGVYLADVSSAAAPKLMFPYRIQIPNLVPRVGKMWFCANQQRLYFLQKGVGIFALEVVNAGHLASLRTNPDLPVSAWDFVRAITGNTSSAVLSLPHAEANALSCAGDALVVVADRTSVFLYDLDDFFSLEPLVPMATLTPQVQLPSDESLEILDVHVWFDVTQETLDLALALGPNGNVEYAGQLTGNTVDFTLIRHRYTIRRAPGFTSPPLHYEPTVRVAVTADRTYFLVDGFQNSDPLYVLDRKNAAGPTTESILYEPADVCVKAATAGEFTGLLECRKGIGDLRLVVDDVTNRVWASTRDALRSYVPQSGGNVTDIALPPVPSAIVLREDAYWVAAERQLLVFDRIRAETEALGPLQSSPDVVLPLPGRVFDIVPKGQASEYLSIGSTFLAWIEAITEPTVLATTDVNFAVAAAAYAPASRLAALVDTAQRRVRILKRSADVVQVEFVSIDGGYGAVDSCGNDILIWKESGGQRIVYRYDQTNKSMAVVMSTPAQSFGHVACNATHVAIVQGVIGSRLTLSVYHSDSGENVSTIELPTLASYDLRSIALRMTSSWIGLQIADRGTYFFDISDNSKPVLTAADPFADIANGGHFSLLELPGSIRYGALAKAAGGRPPWVVVKRTE